MTGARDGTPAGAGGDEAALREALAEGDLARRRDAALALVERAGDGLATATVAVLRERAREDDAPDVRQFAVEALGEAGAGEATLRATLDDPEPWVRAEAVVALSRVGADPAALREALADDDGWVRRNAVIALGKRGDVDQATLVDRIKTDPHPPVREFAAQFLGDAADDTAEAERILAALLARESNAFVRAKAAESLGRLGTDRAETALEDHGVTDRSEDVARTARRALAAARGVDPDQLDVDVEPPASPGTGPDGPADRSVEGFRPRGGDPTGPPGESIAPGGAPGFDPQRDLNADPESRRPNADPESRRPNVDPEER